MTRSWQVVGAVCAVMSGVAGCGGADEDAAQTCFLAADCAEGQVCLGNQCLTPPEQFGECSKDSQCPEQYLCDKAQAVCVYVGPNDGCETASDCEEGE
ncbi:MAG: hypothetical protein ACI9WU_004132, partial [Myxococcota bacterium]